MITYKIIWNPIYNRKHYILSLFNEVKAINGIYIFTDPIQVASLLKYFERLYKVSVSDTLWYRISISISNFRKQKRNLFRSY